MTEMAGNPLRNVDKLIIKEPQFKNKVHTTLIMQTITVSGANLTPL